MDFMAEYGSDSDEADSSHESQQGQQCATTSGTNSIKEDPSIERPKQKKRKINVSFLPLSIQEALMKGNNAESDDDEPHHRSEQSDQPQNTNKYHSTVKQDDPLLRLLPPPKMTSSESHETQRVVSSGVEQRLLPKIATTASTINTPKTDSTIPIRNQHVDKSHDSVAPIDWTKIQTTIPNTPYFQTHSSLAPLEESSSGSISNRKRKERELEMQIQSGNLASLQDLPIQDIERPSDQWDATSYMDKQYREMQIMNEYTNNGTMKSIVQPTKLQNRRHQLSSLALHAAETEIAMMEAKAQRGKSKSQTQSKYGW